MGLSLSSCHLSVYTRRRGQSDLHAGFLNDEGLVLSVRNRSAVGDEVLVHPVEFVGLDGPVVRVCTAYQL